MITLFITAQIIFTLNAGLMPVCKDLSYPALDGCYNNNKVYTSETTSRPKDFVLYHEIGHSLYNKEIRKGKSIFEWNDVEIMAENFVLYIYESKYPEHFIKTEYRDYFQEKCPQKCIDEIINIKVPNMTYP